MTAAAANAIIVRLPDQELREYPVVAADIVYRDTFVGLNPAGMLKPFEVGDEFAGIAYEQADNSAGAAAAIKCRVVTQCDFEFTFSSAANLDSGRAVYCTDDSTIAIIGHPDAWCGRILHKDVDASNKVIVRMKEPHDRWTESDTGAIEFIKQGRVGLVTGAAGAAADFVQPNGMVAASVLGLGYKNLLLQGGGFDLEFDAVAEVADASLRTPAIFLVSNGVTYESTLHLTDIGDNVALDVDWGLSTLTDTASVRADLDTATDQCLFHLDGATATILGQSDDNTTDVAPVTTGISNVTTALAHKEFKVIARPSGVCELWIARARVLASTVLAMRTTALVGGITNIEKTSDDTLAVLRCRKMRVCGASYAL